MTDVELETLLADLESDRSERKESVNDGNGIREAICAFANDMPDHRQPGVVFIGVRDNGSFSGIPITDALLQTLASMRSDGNILPLPTMQVQKRTLQGHEVAVVIVHPSHFPPVRYRGRVCIRVGPRRAYASVDEERRLNERRLAGDLPFDLRPIIAASIHDLDLTQFSQVYLPASVAREVLEQNHRSTEQKLSSARFVASGQCAVPTVVGLIAIGKSPADFVSGAYVQFIRIDGTSLADPIADQRECHGPLTDLMRQLDEIVRANIHVATDIASASLEIRHFDYPLTSLQQYIRNAVMHRNYESSNAPVRVTWFLDRVEIQSPGGPFGQVTIANFGQAGITDYRNPNIAETMKTLGFVQRFGVGLQVAEKALRDNGNPPPEYDVQDNHVLTVVRKRREL